MSTIIHKLIISKLNRCTYTLFILSLLFFLSTGCTKFLSEKPKQTDIVPATLEDLQRLLDNEDGRINVNGQGGVAELVADNFYIRPVSWETGISIWPDDGSNYIWDPAAVPLVSWGNAYVGPIYYSNIVLDQLPLVTTNPGEEEKYNTIKGSALFYRAFAFLGLAQVYSLPYSDSNKDKLGVVLKLTSSATENVSRANIQQTYDRIIADLKEAADLLPTTTVFPTRPTKAAAYGLLARTYLFMRNYTNAGNYANLALQQYSTLIDYNTRVTGTPPTLIAKDPPMPTFNAEVVFHNTGYGGLITNFGRVDSLLYSSYDANDLRKTVFFALPQPNGSVRFQGSYHGLYATFGVFDGIATDELYLMRAECHARAGNKDAALSDLNTLLINRWVTGTFTAVTAADATDALRKILTERRKELVCRGVRWSDVRRFNIADSSITLKRIENNITYTLPPNDLRLALLIRSAEIDRSGIEQNPR